MVRCGSSGFNSITLVNGSLAKENYNALIQRGRKDFSDCQAAVTYVRPGQLNHKSQTVQVLGCGRENLTPRHSPVTQPQRLTLPDVSTGLGFPGHMLLFRHRITSLQTRWSASRSARSAPVWGGHIPASGATHLARLHCPCSAGCWAEQSRATARANESAWSSITPGWAKGTDNRGNRPCTWASVYDLKAHRIFSNVNSRNICAQTSLQFFQQETATFCSQQMQCTFLYPQEYLQHGDFFSLRAVSSLHNFIPDTTVQHLHCTPPFFHSCQYTL